MLCENTGIRKLRDLNNQPYTLAPLITCDYPFDSFELNIGSSRFVHPLTLKRTSHESEKLMRLWNLESVRVNNSVNASSILEKAQTKIASFSGSDSSFAQLVAERIHQSALVCRRSLHLFASSFNLKHSNSASRTLILDLFRDL